MENVIPLRFVEIPKKGTQVLVTAFINGHFANLLIDATLSKTGFDGSRAHIFSIGNGEKKPGQHSQEHAANGEEVKKIVIEQFLLGDLLLEEMEVAVLSLELVNRSFRESGHPPVDMVLGNDFLEHYGMTVDLAKAELAFTVQ